MHMPIQMAFMNSLGSKGFSEQQNMFLKRFSLLCLLTCIFCLPIRAENPSQRWEDISFFFVQKHPQNNVTVWEWTSHDSPVAKLTVLQAIIGDQTLNDIFQALTNKVISAGGNVFYKDLTHGLIAFVLVGPNRSYYEVNLWRYYVSAQHHTSASLGLSWQFNDYASAEKFTETMFQKYLKDFKNNNIPAFDLP